MSTEYNTIQQERRLKRCFLCLSVNYSRWWGGHYSVSSLIRHCVSSSSINYLSLIQVNEQEASSYNQSIEHASLAVGLPIHRRLIIRCLRRQNAFLVHPFLSDRFTTRRDCKVSEATKCAPVDRHLIAIEGRVSDSLFTWYIYQTHNRQNGSLYSLK